MTKAILPIVDDPIARGVNKLVAERPNARRFVFSAEGAYFDAFEGWRAQLKLNRNRLSDEVISCRLTLAQGKALAELAASEFFADVDNTPTSAIGRVVVRRDDVSHGSGPIKQGTRFRVTGDPSASPPIPDVTYVSSEPINIGPTDDLVTVPIIAERPGTDANLALYTNGTWGKIDLADKLFDPNLFVQSYADGDAAGGSLGMNRLDIIALAKAMYTGQFGPTDGALIAGSLLSAGVKHAAVAKDTRIGQSVLFVADGTWASSVRFQDRTKQILKDKWVGFGTRIDVKTVVNTLAALSVTVILRDPKFLDDASTLRAAIRAKVSDYLDNRPNFYTFDLNTIAGIVATADRSRILTCSSAVMTDALLGTPLVSQPINPNIGTVQHYVLKEQFVNISARGPS